MGPLRRLSERTMDRTKNRKGTESIRRRKKNLSPLKQLSSKGCEALKKKEGAASRKPKGTDCRPTTDRETRNGRLYVSLSKIGGQVLTNFDH
jgi:hypothetical protein